MGITIRIAWRSLWRSRRRTVITISAIAFGLAIAVMFLAWADGIYRQMINDAVRMEAGHFTLEHRAYREAPAVDLVVPGAMGIRATIAEMAGVERVKLRVMGQGVLKSGRGAVAAALIGVEPVAERDSSLLAQRIVQGDYLGPGDEGKVVIGVGMAERLKAGVGKKVVVATNNARGELVEELLRVKGIFRVGAPEVDGYVAQVPLNFARRLFDLPAAAATQVGVVVDDLDHRDAALSRVAAEISDARIAVRPWEEVLPELAAYVTLDGGSNKVFQGIIIFLSLFTIANTIIMSVLERTREFAVQLALGTPENFLKRQVLWEGVLLGLVGVVVGLAVGGGLSYWAQREGLDLRVILGDELSVSGFVIDARTYAHVTWGLLFTLGAVVFAATVGVSAWAMRRISRIPVADVLRDRG